MKNQIHVLENKVNHRQMQGIIITTEGGKVIAIDGGRRENADYLIEYLKEITGQAIPVVDAPPVTRPKAGSQPSQLENTLMSNAAKKKDGMEIPIIVTTVTA